MIFFKACPRCRGDMHHTGDYYGEYCQCLQCGHIIDEEDARLVPEELRKTLATLDSQAA